MNIFGVIVSIILLVGLVNLITKIGFPWFYVFFFFVPIVNIFFFVHLCFSTWPIEKELYKYKVGVGDLSVDGLNSLVESTICLSCRAEIPARVEKCPQCGWSYR